MNCVRTGLFLLFIAKQMADTPGTVRECLQEGYDVKKRNSRGQLIIHCAVLSGDNPTLLAVARYDADLVNAVSLKQLSRYPT